MIAVICHSLYILSYFLVFQSGSSATITCANGKWNKQVSCEPVDCGVPDKYHVHPARFSFPDGTTYGKKITFQCREPAQLIGEMHSGTCTDKYFQAIPEPSFARLMKEKYMYILMYM